jgi:hypothetical protein
MQSWSRIYEEKQKLQEKNFFFSSLLEREGKSYSSIGRLHGALHTGCSPAMHPRWGGVLEPLLEKFRVISACSRRPL